MLNRAALRDIRRALANHRYERTPAGIYFPEPKLVAQGYMTHDVNGRDERTDPNLVPTEGLNHMLSVVVNAGTQVTTWYVAPYSGNVSPAASWTAANFTANATEATGYDESTRVAYVEAAPSGGIITNSASKAAFTASGSITVWGAGILSVSTKSAVTGTLLAAAKFASSRSLVATDVLNIGYTLTLTSS